MKVLKVNSKEFAWNGYTIEDVDTFKWVISKHSPISLNDLSYSTFTLESKGDFDDTYLQNTLDTYGVEYE